MFERFTDRARRVVVLAQEEARLLNHDYIGTEHLLLGLTHEGEGIAAQVLDGLGVSLEALRQTVEETVGRGDKAPAGHIPFTPRAKKVLELALREALQLGHNYIGTEHLLLALIREGEGKAAEAICTQLKDHADIAGTSQDVLHFVRKKVIELLAQAPSRPLEPGVPPEPLAGTDFTESHVMRILARLLESQQTLLAEQYMKQHADRSAGAVALIDGAVKALKPHGLSSLTKQTCVNHAPDLERLVGLLVASNLVQASGDANEFYRALRAFVKDCLKQYQEGLFAA